MQTQSREDRSPSPAAQQLPSNPVQAAPMLRLTPTPNTEFISPWNPSDDIDDLEDTVAQATAHIEALLKLLPKRSHRDVIKARAFLAQFEAPKFFSPPDGSED